MKIKDYNFDADAGWIMLDLGWNCPAFEGSQELRLEVSFDYQPPEPYNGIYYDQITINGLYFPTTWDETKEARGLAKINLLETPIFGDVEQTLKDFIAEKIHQDTAESIAEAALR